jgi:hypothetical protein
MATYPTLPPAGLLVLGDLPSVAFSALIQDMRAHLVLNELKGAGAYHCLLG